MKMLNRPHLHSRMIKPLYLIVWFIFCLSPTGFAQDAGIHNTVRVIYFVPQDTTPRPNIHAKLDRLIKDVKQLYANEMQRHGFGRKTFALETNRQDRVVVHRVRGQFPQVYYQYQTENRVSAEITPALISVEMSIWLSWKSVKKRSRTAGVASAEIIGMTGETSADERWSRPTPIVCPKVKARNSSRMSSDTLLGCFMILEITRTLCLMVPNERSCQNVLENG